MVVSSGVAVVVPSVGGSSSLAQEITVRLKRNMEKMMGICLTRFPIGGLVEPNCIASIGLFCKNWEICGGCLTCEELVGVSHR